MKLAQIQMHVTADKAANLRHAEDLLRSVRGADMAILPEMFCCPYDNACFRAYGEPEGGPAYQMLSRTARELRLWLVGGSLPELDGDKIYNTAYVFDPTGTCVARHRKMHLFDIDVQGGQSFRESATLSPGNDITLFDTPYGRIGLSISYDLRIEELCRLMALEGARVLLAPASFNMTTGPALWELLFGQRAVDGQLFTAGTSPARDETASYVAWGHSIVCDPRGTVLHQCGAGEQQTVETAEAVDAGARCKVGLCRNLADLTPHFSEDVHRLISGGGQNLFHFGVALLLAVVQGAADEEAAFCVGGEVDEAPAPLCRYVGRGGGDDR